jgi:hypothetical protein
MKVSHQTSRNYPSWRRRPWPIGFLPGHNRACFVGSPEVRRHLCLASRSIRYLIGVVDKLADRCEDNSYKLRTLRIDVTGC